MKPQCTKEGCKIESSIKGTCKMHYVFPSKLNPKPITPKTVKAVKRPKEKTLSVLLADAQKVFNQFIRLRDSKGTHFVCIACNTIKPLSKMDAGHFYSAGNHSYLRFNENNVHSECKKCNYFMSGHLLAYRENLIKKIGQKELDKLDACKNISQKWDKVQLIALIQLYKEKIKNFNSA